MPEDAVPTRAPTQLPAQVRTPGTPALRLGRHVARHLVRTGRARLRSRRAGHGTTEPFAAGRARIAPANTAHAAAWLRLVAVRGRPHAEGLGASPLGGAARTAGQWRHRLRALRSAGVPAYLVEHEGHIAGEVLVYVDGGTAAAELVVWVPVSGLVDEVVAALAAHELVGDVRRVFLTTPAGSELAGAAERAGFRSEGVLADPPLADRVVYVRHRDVD